LGYSKDLKEKAIAYRESHTQAETCEAYRISTSAIKSWRRQIRETGKLETKPLIRSWRKIDPEKLKADIAENPDSYNAERAERFNYSEEGIRKAMKKLKITRKKRR